MRFLGKILFHFILLVYAADAFGQADPSDPTSVVQVKTKTNSWQFVGSTSVSRGLDEFAKFTASHGVSAAYNLKNRQRLGAGISYMHPFQREVDFPEDWGLSNLSLSYAKLSAFSIFKKQDTSLRVGLTLPTSKSAQRSSLISSLGVSMPVSTSLYGQTIVLVPSVRTAYHTYETGDQFGYRKNSPLAASFTVVFWRALYKRVSGNLSFSYSNIFDYDFNSTQVQGVDLSLTTPISKSASLTGGFYWQDRVFTYNPVFDDDRSSYYLALNFTM